MSKRNNTKQMPSEFNNRHTNYKASEQNSPQKDAEISISKTNDSDNTTTDDKKSFVNFYPRNENKESSTVVESDTNESQNGKIYWDQDEPNVGKVKVPSNAERNLSTILLQGWRRDSGTNLWVPHENGDNEQNPQSNSQFAMIKESQKQLQQPNNNAIHISEEISTIVDISDKLYCKGGYCFPLIYNEINYEIPVSINGKVLPLIISTVRRTLTLSSRDTYKCDLSAEEDDLVCCFPNKNCQLYCGAVIFVNESSGKSTRISKCDYYVSEGNFKSRLGLLGTTDKRSLFTHLRMRTDLFCLSLRNRQENFLIFGERATPSPNTKRIKLQQWTYGKKEMLVLPCHYIKCSRMKYAFKEGISAIVHLEMPDLCLPNSLYEELIKSIRRRTGLFTNNELIESQNKIESVRNKFPSIRLWIKCEDSSYYKLIIYPEQYLVQRGKSKNYTIAAKPLAKNCATSCVILGNIAFQRKRLSVSLSQNNAWIW